MIHSTMHDAVLSFHETSYHLSRNKLLCLFIQKKIHCSLADYFVRSSRLLHTKFWLLCMKFRATLYQVWLLRTKCVHMCKSTSYKLRPTSNEHRANFVQTLVQLQTNFKLTSCELRANFVRTSRSTNFAWYHNFRGYCMRTNILTPLIQVLALH